LSGRIEYPDGPPEALNSADMTAGYVLFCSALARSDLSIEICPPEIG